MTIRDKKIIKVSAAIIVGVYIVINSINAIYKQSEIALDEFIVIGKLVIIATIFIAIFYFDFREYSKHKLPSSFIPTSIFTSFIFITIGIKLFFLLRESSTPVLTAKNDNACYIILRENGTYKISNYNLFGIDIFWGQYNLNDSLISFDREDFNESSLGKYLKITKVDSTILIAKANKDGKIISNNTFKIIEK